MESTTIKKSEKVDTKNIRVGKTPLISNNKPSYIIGIIDCSGSMSSRFPDLCPAWNNFKNSIGLNNITTVLFCHESEILEGDLEQKHCRGTTNILAGFHLAFEEISKKKSLGISDFTILFISDGCDNNQNTIQERVNNLSALDPALSVNVICLGVGTGFPTFISMDLRKKFHNGSISIPPVFLLYAEPSGDSNNEFETNLIEIKNKYSCKKEIYEVSPSVKRYLWDENSQKNNLMLEDEYFFTEKNEEEIFYNNTHRIETIPFDELNLTQSFDLLRIITSDLQLRGMSNKNQNVKKEAEIAYDYFAQKLEYLKSLNSVLKKDFTKTPKTLKERLLIKQEKSEFVSYENLLSELKNLKTGESLLNLSEAEAAKRLAIGTKTGKYHSKALQFRGLDDRMFKKYKNDFKEILEKNKLSETSTQENSLILLQNQKDILRENDLINQIQNCSIFNLLDLIPIVGQTVLIKISDSSMINPYNLNVIFIPKINKTCDLYSITDSGNEMEISIGNDQVENFNAVLPLFDEGDKDIKPFIRSSIFHLLMTFNCMRNLDTIFLDAYLALICNFYVKIVKEPESTFKEEIINKLCFTAEMVYGEDSLLEKTVNIMKGEFPRKALMNECTELNHKCENVSKAIFALMILKSRKILDEKKYSEIIEYIIIEHVGRMLKGKSASEYLEFYSGEEIKENYKEVTYDNDKKDEDKNNDKDKLDDIKEEKEDPDLSVPSVVKKFNKYLAENNLINDDPKDIKTNFKKFFEENYKWENFCDITKMNVKLNMNFFNKNYIKTNFKFFYDLQSLICPNIELNEEIFWIAVNHNINFPNFDDRNLKEIYRKFPECREKIKEENLTKNIKAQINQLHDDSLKFLIEEFNNIFIEKLKSIHDEKFSTELLKRKAFVNEDFVRKNIMFLGLKNSGKSSLVGKIMHKLDLVDKDLFQVYIDEARKIFPQKKDYIPYAWISDTAANERINEGSCNTNISHINFKENHFLIFDTPGKFKNFNASLKDLFLIDNFFVFLPIEKTGSIYDFDNSNFLKNQIKMLHYSQDVKNFNLILTLENSEENFNKENILKTLMDINSKIKEIISKNHLVMNFSITPISIEKDLNITESNFLNDIEENSNDLKDLNLSRKSILDLLCETKEKFGYRDPENFSAKKDLFNSFKEFNEFNFSADSSSFQGNSDILKLINETKTNTENSNGLNANGTLLGRKINYKHFNGKLIYAKVVSGEIKKNDILLILPSFAKFRVESLRTNYSEISKGISGDQVTIMLEKFENDDKLGFINEENFHNGCIIKVFRNEENLISKQDKYLEKFCVNKKAKNLKKTKIKAEVYILGKLEENRQYNVIYNGFEVSMILNSKKKIENSENDKNSKPEKYEVELFTLTDNVIMNEFWNKKNDSRIVFKGKYYNIEGAGNITKYLD